jgi:hypothetical protein
MIITCTSNTLKLQDKNCTSERRFFFLRVPRETFSLRGVIQSEGVRDTFEGGGLRTSVNQHAREASL